MTEEQWADETEPVDLMSHPDDISAALAERLRLREQLAGVVSALQSLAYPDPMTTRREMRERALAVLLQLGIEPTTTRWGQ